MTYLLRCAVALLGLLLCGGARATPPPVAVAQEPMGQGGAVILAPGASALFRAGYERDGWRGTLRREAFAVDGDGEQRAGDPVWSADALLSGDPGAAPPRAPTPPPAQRNIFTFSDSAQARRETLPFTWDGLGPAQRAALDRVPYRATGSDGLGRQRLDYLRGDRAMEQVAGPFRRRTGLLGDIVNSVPVHVGAPARGVRGDGYAEFHARLSKRRAAVYVGANDGMLHAFDARDGTELFAYVPAALLTQLNQLTSPDYVHRPYVDGAPGVGEARLAGGWGTVLVAGMGGGAQGVFALDITQPTAFAEGRGVLWEFTDEDDPAMGNVWAAPLVARFRTGAPGKAPAYRDFAVVASGVNNYLDDGEQRFVSDARAALFLLALDKAPAARWQEGVNYFKFSLPQPDSGSANGLGMPALVLDGEGGVRIAYAGDLQGGLWRIDFSDGAPWRAAARPQLVFEARAADGARQPITQRPQVVFAPGGGYLVLFGTGKFMEEADRAPEGFSPQSFYAVHDRNRKGELVGKARVLDRRALVQRTVSVAPGKAGVMLIDGGELFYGEGGKHGWYIDFPDAVREGERSVSDAVVAGGNVFFNSLLVGRDRAKGPVSRAYMLDALNGLAAGGKGEQGAGAPTMEASTGPPLVVALGTQPIRIDATGRAVERRSYAVFGAAPGSAKGAVARSGKVSVDLPSRRMSWREVANWDELHEQTRK